jgi:hypothetical protein
MKFQAKTQPEDFGRKLTRVLMGRESVMKPKLGENPVFVVAFCGKDSLSLIEYGFFGSFLDLGAVQTYPLPKGWNRTVQA